MDNTARGMLAEFLVATAVGQQEHPRVEWEQFDLCTPSGVTIEVKSAAAIQSWKQVAPTPIQFTIGPRQGWDSETGQYNEQARRWADLYVFCVLEGADPLDMDKWQFYVLPSAVLDDACQQQQTIRLAARGKSPAAFDRRCIPLIVVVHRSNTTSILPLLALLNGRIADLGATRGSTTGC